MTRDHDNTIEQCESVLVASSPNKNLKTRKPEKNYFYDKTIDNKKDNTLKKDTIGKEVLQSIGSVHDKTLDNVLEAPIHNKIKLSCEECNFETLKIKK